MRPDQPLPSIKAARKARREALRLAGEAASPPPERARHDPVQVVEERDPNGWPVRHFRVSDSIGRLVRGGVITGPVALAADRFRKDYHMAQFDPLSAMDIRRPRGAGGKEAIIDRVEAARDRVARALLHLGGMSSAAGSAIWFVVGAEMSIQEWSLRQEWGSGRPLRHDMATGILVAALGTLEGFYRIGRARETARKVDMSKISVLTNSERSGRVSSS
jgi:hypothetical protein